MERKSLRLLDPPPASRILGVLALALFLAIVAASAYRVFGHHYPGPGHSPKEGMGFCDFYNGVYYPTKGFLAKDNPCGTAYAQQYPVSRPVPLFSPLVFVIHAPFALLDPGPSATIYFGWLVATVLLLAMLTVKVCDRQFTAFAVFGVAAYFLFTRAGQSTIVNGYFTFELVIGTILALHYGDKKPILAGAGLALASCKPTYAIPLMILMLARRNFKAAIAGSIFSALFLIAGIAWLALDDSILGVIEVFRQGQESHSEFPNLWPANTWTRIDLLAIASKWGQRRPDDLITLLTMLGILAVPCGLLLMLTKPTLDRRLDSGAAGMIGLLCMLSMLLAVYHHSYDASILVVPTVAMILQPTGDWKNIPKMHRAVLACLINLPLFNYVSAQSVLGRMDLEPGTTAYALITSANTICLGVALAYVAVTAWIHQTNPRMIFSGVPVGQS